MADQRQETPLPPARPATNEGPRIQQAKAFIFQNLHHTDAMTVADIFRGIANFPPTSNVIISQEAIAQGPKRDIFLSDGKTNFGNNWETVRRSSIGSPAGRTIEVQRGHMSFAVDLPPPLYSGRQEQYMQILITDLQQNSSPRIDLMDARTPPGFRQLLEGLTQHLIELQETQAIIDGGQRQTGLATVLEESVTLLRSRIKADLVKEVDKAQGLSDLVPATNPVAEKQGEKRRPIEGFSDPTVGAGFAAVSEVLSQLFPDDNGYGTLTALIQAKAPTLNTCANELRRVVGHTRWDRTGEETVERMLLQKLMEQIPAEEQAALRAKAASVVDALTAIFALDSVARNVSVPYEPLQDYGKSKIRGRLDGIVSRLQTGTERQQIKSKADVLRALAQSYINILPPDPLLDKEKRRNAMLGKEGLISY